MSTDTHTHTDGELSSRHLLPAPLIARLTALYEEPHRHYHTLAHVNALLTHLKQHAHLAKAPAIITAAIWLHDAIYDTYRDDNEERSAEMAQTELEAAGWDALQARRVADMVRATRHHKADAADTDTLLFLDLDLSILGASPLAYDAYSAAIRAEFSWVPEAGYVQGRKRVLQSFLQRDAIYRTPPLRDAWEPAARLNLKRELDALA